MLKLTKIRAEINYYIQIL